MHVHISSGSMIKMALRMEKGAKINSLLYTKNLKSILYPIKFLSISQLCWLASGIFFVSL